VLAGAPGMVLVPVMVARTAAFLIWARAVRAVCLLMAFQVRAWDWSRPKESLEVVAHYGASTGFRPRSSLRIRGIRWLAGGCR
jgi:hypothetical protein